MPTNAPSTSKKKKTTTKTKPSSAASTPPETTQPEFKQWRIEKLADIAKVDECQLDKVIYFLNHSMRKCRLQNKVLIAMNYHEQGRITLETKDKNEEEAEVPFNPLA